MFELISFSWVLEFCLLCTYVLCWGNKASSFIHRACHTWDRIGSCVLGSYIGAQWVFRQDATQISRKLLLLTSSALSCHFAVQFCRTRKPRLRMHQPYPSQLSVHSPLFVYILFPYEQMFCYLSFLPLRLFFWGLLFCWFTVVYLYYRKNVGIQRTAVRTRCASL